jgi:hypothetical protein
MVSSRWATILGAAVLAVTVQSVDVVYVTDIEIFTYLVGMLWLEEAEIREARSR